MKDSRMPILDIASLQDGYIEQMSQSEWEEKAKEIDQAFCDYGFVYLKNHGISPELIKDAIKLSAEFFSMSKEAKRPFTKSASYFGYFYPGDKLTTEVVAQDLIEFREMWDVPPVIGHSHCPKYPAEVKGFQSTLEEMITQTRMLVVKLLRLISRALGRNEDYLAQFHTSISDKTGVKKRFHLCSNFRSLYYPALNKTFNSPLNAVRCREHTDYGTITLIFQDLVGGLQMKLKDGSWMDAAPIPDTIIVNVSDLLGRLTGGYYMPIIHRVPVPEDLTISRQSISYFLAPDDDALIQPIVPPEKIKIDYMPVVTGDYYNNRVDYFNK